MRQILMTAVMPPSGTEDVLTPLMRNEHRPLLSSGCAWNLASLDHYAVGPTDLTETCLLGHTLVVYLGRPMTYEFVSPGWRKRQRVEIMPWDVSVLPAQIHVGGSHESSFELVTLQMDPRLLTETIGVSANAELAPLLNIQDSFISQLVLELRRDLQNAGLQHSLYRDAMLASLVQRIHLKRCPGHTDRGTSGKLSPLLVSHVIEIIHARLEAGISLSELAAQAGMDQFSFLRLFKRTTGSTPHQYMIRARIARAKAMLHATKLSVTEIALRCGFASSSHFADTFKKLEHGTAQDFRGRRQSPSELLPH